MSHDIRSQLPNDPQTPSRMPYILFLNRLQSFEKLHESCRILCAANLILPLDREIGHTADVRHLRMHHLLVDFTAPFVTLQPFSHLGFGQSSLDAGLPENIMACNILFVLEVRLEEFLHHPGLHLRTLGLPQLDQTMAVSCVARLAAELEDDANVLARSVQALEDHLRTLLAEFGLVILAFVYALFRRGRVQVEWEPGGREGILRVWVARLVQRDPFLEFVFPDIALCKQRSVLHSKLIYSSSDELTHGQTVSDTISMLKFVILLNVCLSATVRCCNNCKAHDEMTLDGERK